MGFFGRESARTSGLALSLLVILSGCSMLPDTPVTPGQEGPLDFIRSDRYDAMVFEVDHSPGVAPHSSAMSLVKQRATERLDKPAGITSTTTQISDSRGVWTEDDLRRVEGDRRDSRSSGDTAILYVLYVDGRSARDTDNRVVLGIHYGASSIAIFKESIAAAEYALLSFGALEVEEAVLVHEFGHAIGLVNNGVPMVTDHEGKGDGQQKHSGNEDSVMYYAVEDSRIFGLFGQAPPNNFDTDDIADIRAAGGR